VELGVHDKRTSGRRTAAWQSLVPVSPFGALTGGGGGSVVDVVVVVVDPPGERPTVVTGVEVFEPDATVVEEPVLVSRRAGDCTA
jgi:hypothetical protein